MTKAATQNNGRADDGRFLPGNAGGPGRPRRAVETDYLRVLSDACPLDDWRIIVSRAVEDAQAGDARAREWISRFVLGEQGGHPLEILARTEQDPANSPEILERWRRIKEAEEESSLQLAEALAGVR
jgi:hypothetical protein